MAHPASHGWPRARAATVLTIRAISRMPLSLKRYEAQRHTAVRQKADSGTSIRALSVASAMARSALSLGRTLRA